MNYLIGVGIVVFMAVSIFILGVFAAYTQKFIWAIIKALAGTK